MICCISSAISSKTPHMTACANTKTHDGVLPWYSVGWVGWSDRFDRLVPYYLWLIGPSYAHLSATPPNLLDLILQNVCVPQFKHLVQLIIVLQYKGANILGPERYSWKCQDFEVQTLCSVTPSISLEVHCVDWFGWVGTNHTLPLTRWIGGRAIELHHITSHLLNSKTHLSHQKLPHPSCQKPSTSPKDIITGNWKEISIK